MGIDRKHAAGVLREIAALMEVNGDNPHRIRAFANAGRIVERLEGDLDHLVSSSQILEVRGIGKGTASVLAELISGATPEVLSGLRRAIPADVRELLDVAGLGPKKVRSLWRDLDITSLGELEYACRENRLVALPGFGRKSQQRLLESVGFLQSSRERHLLHQAAAQAREVMDALSRQSAVERVAAAGELRRGCETVGTIDLVVVGDSAGIEGSLKTCTEKLEAEAPDSFVGFTNGGIRVHVRSVRMDRYGPALVWATGSEEHVAALGRRAADAGYVFDEDGLSFDGGEVACPDEESLYDALDCQWVPPELREDGRDVEVAARGELPALIEASDLRGALHNHTTDSDGSATVAEMAHAAGRLGWSHIGIADHSPAAHYANGLDADRLRRQWELIDELNSGSSYPRVVKGLEADILGDGTLDIPEACERGLEYVVASVHSSFRLPEEVQTDRILRAVRHPACRVLGHPTGRLLLARPGYAVDLEQVLQVCAEHVVAVEINASPYRLDLDWRWARRAIELGVPLVINPDAHAIDGLEDVAWGVTVARKAGATPDDVLNCFDVAEFVASRRR